MSIESINDKSLYYFFVDFLIFPIQEFIVYKNNIMIITLSEKLKNNLRC